MIICICMCIHMCECIVLCVYFMCIHIYICAPVPLSYIRKFHTARLTTLLVIGLSYRGPVWEIISMIVRPVISGY